LTSLSSFRKVSPEVQVIALSDFFDGLTKLEMLILGKEVDLVARPWYPITGEGRIDLEAASQRFRGWHDTIQKEWPAEVSKKYLPLKDTPVSDDQYDPHNAGYCIGGGSIFGGYSRRQDAFHRLRPPLWLGERVTIHSFTKLIGPAIIGDQAEIGSYVNVTRAFMRGEVDIDNYAEVSDAMIGRNVRIGARVTILHKIQPPHKIDVEDFVHYRPTTTVTRRRMGAVIGDGCVIGAGAILEPGVFLMPGCQIHAGAIVRAGIYGPKSRI
jgi:acetyltransferase-like isoleucine patch superfamily enzyme